MQWSTYLGGSKDDGGHAIGVDGNNNVIVTGLVQSTNFPVTAGAYQTVNINMIEHKVNDDFLTKFSPTGSVIWSTYSNVFSENGAQSMTIDQYNNIYVTDDIEFSGPDTPKVLVPPITGLCFDKNFNTNNFTVADVAGGEDNYITKYNTNGFPCVPRILVAMVPMNMNRLLKILLYKIAGWLLRVKRVATLLYHPAPFKQDLLIPYPMVHLAGMLLT